MKLPKWLRIAKMESEKSDYHQKMGAVAVKGGSLVSKGFNQVRFKSIGMFKYTKWQGSLHAERDCLSKISKEDAKGCTVYIYREHADGKPALAKPCSQCAFMLYDLGVKRVVYTTNKFPYYRTIKL